MTENCLLDTAQAAKRLSLSVSLLAKLRLSGEGPEYVKLGTAVRYRPESLEKYISERSFRSTAEADQHVTA